MGTRVFAPIQRALAGLCIVGFLSLGTPGCDGDTPKNAPLPKEEGPAVKKANENMEDFVKQQKQQTKKP